jgi:hypothetical protein
MLEQDLLWARMPDFAKLLLIDFFHRERRSEDIPSIEERAKAFGRCRKVVMDAEAWLEANGYLLVARPRGGRCNVYVVAFPAIPEGHADRAAFVAESLKVTQVEGDLSHDSLLSRVTNRDSAHARATSKQDSIPESNTKTHGLPTENGAASPCLKESPDSKPTLEDHWQAFLAAYPKRSGSRENAKGRLRFLTLLKEGLDPDLLVSSARRYADWAAATGNAGTEFVKQIPTFLNGSCWLEDWEIPLEAWSVPIGRGARPPGCPRGGQREGGALPVQRNLRGIIETWMKPGLPPGVSAREYADELGRMCQEDRANGQLRF